MTTIYNTRDAAKYLTISKDILHHSRKSGILLGRTAPAHIALGTRSIRYRIDDLEKWVGEAEKKTKSDNANREK